MEYPVSGKVPESTISSVHLLVAVPTSDPRSHAWYSDAPCIHIHDCAILSVILKLGVRRFLGPALTETYTISSFLFKYAACALMTDVFPNGMVMIIIIFESRTCGFSRLPVSLIFVFQACCFYAFPPPMFRVLFVLSYFSLWTTILITFMPRIPSPIHAQHKFWPGPSQSPLPTC